MSKQTCLCGHDEVKDREIQRLTNELIAAKERIRNLAAACTGIPGDKLPCDSQVLHIANENRENAKKHSRSLETIERYIDNPHHALMLDIRGMRIIAVIASLKTRIRELESKVSK